MEYGDEQRLEKELLEIKDFSQRKRAFLHPWLLLKNSRKISSLKDQLEKARQNLETNSQNDREKKVRIENLERHIRFLQNKLDIIDHNFIFFSAVTSFSISIVSFSISIISFVISIIWKIKSRQ
jgi:hypothetical protein